MGPRQPKFALGARRGRTLALGAECLLLWQQARGRPMRCCSGGCQASFGGSRDRGNQCVASLVAWRCRHAGGQDSRQARATPVMRCWGRPARPLNCCGAPRPPCKALQAVHAPMAAAAHSHPRCCRQTSAWCPISLCAGTASSLCRRPSDHDSSPHTALMAPSLLPTPRCRWQLRQFFLRFLSCCDPGRACFPLLPCSVERAPHCLNPPSLPPSASLTSRYPWLQAMQCNAHLLRATSRKLARQLDWGGKACVHLAWCRDGSAGFPGQCPDRAVKSGNLQVVTAGVGLACHL